MQAYPMHIFAVDISSVINKEFHCIHTKFSNCNVQRSPLIERLKKMLKQYSYCDSEID